MLYAIIWRYKDYGAARSRLKILSIEFLAKRAATYIYAINQRDRHLLCQSNQCSLNRGIEFERARSPAQIQIVNSRAR